MATLRCRLCGGIYDDRGADGMLYFHACPPLSPAEVAAAIDAGTIRLQPGETLETAIGTRVFPRPGARDENIDRAKVAATRNPDGSRARGLGDDAIQKAPGAGADVLASAPRDHAKP